KTNSNRNAMPFQLRKPVDNRVEEIKQQQKKDPPHQVTKSGESNQRDGEEEQIAGLGFNFASLLEHTAMQEFVKAAAAVRGIDHAFKSIQPNRRLQLDRTHDRFETRRHVSN